MAVTPMILLLCVLWIFVPAAAVVGIVFLVRYFIRYHEKIKEEKTKQDELDRMKIDDL